MGKSLIRPLTKTLLGSLIASAIKPIQRYVTTLNPAGGMYYEVPRTVIPANADFEWEFELASNGDVFHVFADNTNLNRLAINGADWIGQFSTTSSSGNAWRNDGKLHKLKFTRVSSDWRLYVDGVLDCQVNSNVEITFNVIGGKFGGTTTAGTFNGSFFNSKLTVPSNTALNHDYRFNDNDGVLIDHSGNNANGSSVNVTAADRELMTFDVTRNAWVGGEFVRNGDFSLDGSGWFTLGNPGGWSFDGVKAVLTGDGTPQSLDQTTLRPMSDKDNYLISFDVFADSSEIGMQSSSGVIKLSGSSGRVSGIVKLEHTRVSIKRDSGSVNGWIDNVSVKRAIEVAQ